MERSADDPVDKAHRLRRATLVWTLLMAAFLVLAQVERPLDERVLGDTASLVVLVALPVAIVGSLLGAYLGVRPVYEHLRGIAGTTQKVSRRMTRQLLVLLAPQAIWLGVFVLLLGTDAHPALILAAVVASIVSLTAAGPSSYAPRSRPGTQNPTTRRSCAAGAPNTESGFAACA